MLILETLLRNLKRVYMYTSTVLVMIMADIGKPVCIDCCCVDVVPSVILSVLKRFGSGSQYHVLIYYSCVLLC